MAIDINNITEIDLEGNGSFDKFMRTLRLHINDAVENNEISQTEAGQIYTGVIPGMLSQAVEFELRKDIVDKDLLIKDEQKITEQLSQQALIAQTKDQYGFTITEDSITSTSDLNLIHTQQIEKAKQDVLTAQAQVELAQNQSEIAKYEIGITLGRALQDYGLQWNGTTEEWDNVIGVATPLINEGIRTLKIEAELIKASKEANIGEKTADGYAADAYYKQFRALQELMFALANSGVVDENGGSDSIQNDTIYGKLVQAMENTMNKQIEELTGIPGTINLN